MSKKLPNAVDKFVGEKIKSRRQHLGLNQTQLAEPLGITYQQVQKYEMGNSRIGAGRLQQIANLLQVPVAFFFEGAPSLNADRSGKSAGGPLPDYAKSFIATQEGLAIAKAFTRIESTDVKDSLTNLIQCVAAADAGK